MRALILNECFSDNIGDQAISFAMRQALEDRGVVVNVRDFSCRKKYVEGNVTSYSSRLGAFLPSFLKRVLFVFRNLLFVLRESMQTYDVAIIGGGQLVLGGSNFPWATFLWVLPLKIRRVKVFLVSVGVGENFSLVDKFLYRCAFFLVDGFYLRDRSSISGLKREFGISAGYCPDIAYYLDAPIRLAEKSAPPKALVCITDYSVYQRYIEEMGGQLLEFDDYVERWAGLIRHKVAQGMEVVLAATTYADLEISIGCAKKFVSCSFVKCLNYLPDHNEFMNVAAQCEVVLAGRMHALILGHIAHAKVEPFYISKKIEGYAQEYLSERVEDIKSCIVEVLDLKILPRCGGG